MIECQHFHQRSTVLQFGRSTAILTIGVVSEIEPLVTSYHIVFLARET